MFRKVRKYIEKHSLIGDDAEVVVALSGGADSVALLHILMRLDYRLQAVHCNFHLRGDESMRDELFVRAMCRRLNVELTVVDFDTVAYADEKKISIEMAARELRYDFFEKVRSESGADVIAVAHHRDDVAETMLLNLMRGTGIKGLHGIRPRNGNIVRPLLCVGRDDILAYLSEEGEEYVTDSSNLSNDYTRNKIRLDILPLMREINPSVAVSLAESAERIAQAEKVYRCAIDEGRGRVFVDEKVNIDALLKEPSPAALLHEILSEYGFNGAQSDDILANINGVTGKEYSSATHILTRDRGFLLLRGVCEDKNVDAELSTDGLTQTPYGGIKAEIYPFDGVIDKKKSVAMLDYDKLKLPLRVRSVRAGDRFSPFGMRGSKLVSDFLTDIKKPLPEKRRQLAVVDSDDRILWLVGERTASCCAVGKESTKILKLEWLAFSDKLRL